MRTVPGSRNVGSRLRWQLRHHIGERGERAVIEPRDQHGVGHRGMRHAACGRLPASKDAPARSAFIITVAKR
jgi:hypothetical protein